MAEILVMPKLGLTMEEGFLEAWLCQTGAEVALGQPICEVETDKLTVAVESPYAGVLLRRIEPGSTVPVGEPIAVIGQAGEDPAPYRLYQPGDPQPPGPQPPNAPPTAGTPSLAAQPPAVPTPADPPGADSGPTTSGPAGAPAPHDHPSATPGPAAAPASPLARRIAASLGVDLATVTGTGPDGRITREDVERAAAQLGGTVSPPGEENPR
jgi:pyruvate/2-oxoglutarate dehydrogenase complex dihydrolipoamide acyltransferase (E2) component